MNPYASQEFSRITVKKDAPPKPADANQQNA